MKVPATGLVLLDNSTLSDYQHCARRYWWRHEMSLAPGFPSIALGFGLAYHEAMDVAYTWLQANPGQPFTQDIVNRARIKARESYALHVPEDAALTEELRTSGKLDSLLVKYFKQYAHEPFTVLGTEQSFALALTATGHAGVITDAPGPEVLDWAADMQRDGLDPVLLWIGRMDLVVDWSGIRTIDHKTTSAMGANWAKQWSPNTQFAGYIAVLEQLYDHHRVNGAVINGVQVAKTLSAMVRHPTTRRPDELAEFHRTVTTWARHIQADTVYPMNTTSCTAYGECPYRQLCLRFPAAPCQDKNLLLASVGTEYKIETWSPLDRAAIPGG
jgi:hypothetical protein